MGQQHAIGGIELVCEAEGANPQYSEVFSLQNIKKVFIQGLPTSTLPTPPIWDSLTPYVNGDIVSYSGSNYICSISNTGIVPGTSGDWLLLQLYVSCELQGNSVESDIKGTPDDNAWFPIFSISFVNPDVWTGVVNTSSNPLCARWGRLKAYTGTMPLGQPADIKLAITLQE